LSNPAAATESVPARPGGRVIVLSGPAGAGKTTVAERLCHEVAGLRRSISATTRAPRPGELDGRDYYFLTEGEFLRRLARGEFLEHARVHGHLYGTPRAPVEEALRAGESRLLAIDVQGAMQVRSAMPDALLVFLDAPDDAVLNQRLADRRTDAEEERRRRLATAAAERVYRLRYDHCVTNDDLDRTVTELRALIAGGRMSEPRRPRVDG